MNNQEEINQQKNWDPEKSPIYDSLFELLKKAPDEVLREDFSKHVIRKIQKRESSRRSWFYLWSVIGILISLASTLTVLIYYFGLDSLNLLMDATGWAVFAGITIVVIQYFDQKLIHRRRLRAI